MNVFEKGVEEWIKQQLMEYVKKNNIILKNHHGGLADHSTMTAKIVLDHHCHKCLDDDKLGVVLTTDFSSAFDAVDHSILL